MVNKRAGMSEDMPAFSMRCAVGLMLILLPGGVPFFQLWRRASSASSVGDRASGGFEQHQQVVYQVGGFVDHRFAVACHGFDHGFHSLFTHFLCDLVHAAVEEFARVGALGHLGVSPLDDALQIADEAFRPGRGPVEAARRSGVAGRAVGDGTYEERVVVAVGRDRYDVEVVAARFAFCPEAAARAAVKGDAAF